MKRKNTVRYIQKRSVLWLALVAVIIVVGLVVAYSLLSTKTIEITSTSKPVAYSGRGARLPYVEYQAEDAVTNANKIGPDRTFTHLASEASGRKAVQLNAQGQ